MGFLNAMLLFGAAACVVPLGIHLLNRSRFYSVDWAAMHLLDVSDLQNARRIEWRSLLLLALRCLIPVVLAVCMARPLLQTAVVGGASGRSTTVLLLDTSFSLQGVAAGSGGSASGWDTATAAADSMVDELAGQAELAMLAVGGEARGVEAATRGDPRPILGAIRRMAPVDAGLDLAGGIRLAGAICGESREPHRQAVLLSDFQRTDWTGSVEAAIETMQRQWETQPVRPEIHLIPIEVPPQANVSIAFDAPQTEVSLPGEPLDLQITVVNHGDRQLTGVPLRLAIDGRAIVARQIDIEAKATAQLQVTVEFEKPGGHLATVEVDDPAGQITADDRDSLPIQTLATRRVLLVEREPGPSLFECETGFLQLALEATAGERPQGQAADIRRVASADVAPEAIRQADVIVLADVPQLPVDAVNAIAERVADGGLLCVFAGASLDPTWYERSMGPASEHPLLPWRYGQASAAEDGEASLRGGPYADPLLAFFDDPRQGQLSSATLTAWRQLEPWPAVAGKTEDRLGNDVTGPKPLLETQQGQPILAAAPFGRGRVVQWAITADEASGTLPLEPAYVPLMQRLLLLDLSSATSRNPQVWQREATLDPLSRDERASLAMRLGVTLHATVDDFLAHNRNRQGGHEIWRWLLGVLLVVLFAEMLVAGRLTKRGGR
jgi:hypothetical protein